ncbi:hypothetical protein PSTG_06383 [Puccinia striiformis f. sp. tritici PST-78]|uniref:THIF-type NAD/FAD binding fold domain-containing protein n=1 Tax=Puccinia striiformis f. sp. tritici PST-78 TaxID=1165861 RepID=A0A0L0VME7_9BASI|nr:hypothetical protein PSTG_06383 [Puccinia striiformis f. sp. tritici PST-78]
MAQLGTTFLSTSHRSSLAITQAIVVGVVSGALAALAMYSFQGSANSTPADDPKARKKPCTENPVHDESLIAEQLARNLAFLGPPGNQNVRNAFVIIIGLGGVGSSAATSLVRSGVGRIRLIDFDQVTLSSLNRHATATREDVGISKVISCKNFYQKIAPWLKIEALVEQFTIADAPRLLDGNPDWVLDCIDNITTKVDLLTYCKKNDLKVFSALGAASKADPSRIQIADISMTFEDPLARSVRRRLWSMDEELHWTNCVVMDRSEADIHQQKVLVDRQDPRLVWGSETVELVKARFSEELQMRKWR